ncbi:MAG: thioredoxin domain-containing protein [Bdellovibrionales bacterium]|nr:DsbA family protein [Bdellovibrionales bacterium]NQZ19384.1 thioredoxin domain-containing protein [Bdellovibrionales bacterium]
MKILILFLIIPLTISCTKNEDKNISNKNSAESSRIVNFESPISFTYSEEAKKNDLAYKVGDVEYSLSQMINSDRSLKRLIEENKSYWFVSAYMQALGLKSKGETSIKVQLPFTEANLNTSEALNKKGLSEDEAITVSFSETDNLDGVTLVNDKKFTQTELAKYNFDHSRSLEKIFNLAMKRIETRLSRALINDAANKKQQNFNDYVAANSESQTEATDEEVFAWAQNNNIPKKEIDEKMMLTIRQNLSSKKQSKTFLTLAAKILDGKSVQVPYFRPYIVVQNVIYPEGTPKLGNGNVNVTIISNFQCKRCAKTELKIAELMNNLSDKVQLSYLFKIRPEERMSKFAAEAGLCVAKMDQDKFWEFHQETLNEDFEANETKINDIVTNLGLSVDDLKNCFSSRESSKTLQSQLEVTDTMKTLTLPLVMINGNIIENPSSMAPIKNLIDYEFKNYKPMNKASKGGFFGWLKSLFS